MRYIDSFTKKKLNRYYGLKRQVAEREHKRMLDSLYIRYPELKTLENARVSAGLAELKKSISSNSAINQKQTKSLDEVEEEIQNFLDLHDIPRDYQEIRYDCPYCQDTGWAGDDYCLCVEKSLNEINQADNLFLPPKNTKFSNFNLAAFSDTRQAEFFQGRMSPREAMKGIRAWLTQYVNNFNENKANLFLFGSPGTGKTFMMGCVANSLLNKGHSVVFLKAVQLFELLAKQRIILNSFSPDPEEEDTVRRKIDLISQTELLCIDDLGLEAKGFLNSYADLIVLLDERFDKNLPVIITSNLKPRDLGDEYDERIQSRITGNYELNLFEGEDVRKRIARYNKKIRLQKSQERREGDES